MKSGSVFLRDMRRAGGEQPPGQQQQRHQQAERDDAEQLVGLAPTEMVDQKLRGRQQRQHAAAHRRIDHGHRGRQLRPEPAAEQDRVRHVADEGNANADAEADARAGIARATARGLQSGSGAEQQEAERIDDARSGMIEQAPDQRRGQSADEPGERIDRDDLRTIPAEIFRDRLQEDGEAFARGRGRARRA